MTKICVLDDGDCTTWASDAIVIAVPTQDFEADEFDDGKACRAYLSQGVSAQKAVQSIIDAKSMIEERLNTLWVSKEGVGLEIQWLEKLLKVFD